MVPFLVRAGVVTKVWGLLRCAKHPPASAPPPLILHPPFPSPPPCRYDWLKLEDVRASLFVAAVRRRVREARRPGEKVPMWLKATQVMCALGVCGGGLYLGHG